MVRKPSEKTDSNFKDTVLNVWDEMQYELVDDMPPLYALSRIDSNAEKVYKWYRSRRQNHIRLAAAQRCAGCYDAVWAGFSDHLATTAG